MLGAHLCYSLVSRIVCQDLSMLGADLDSVSNKNLLIKLSKKLRQLTHKDYAEFWTFNIYWNTLMLLLH